LIAFLTLVLNKLHFGYFSIR